MVNSLIVVFTFFLAPAWQIAKETPRMAFAPSFAVDVKNNLKLLI